MEPFYNLIVGYFYDIHGEGGGGLFVFYNEFRYFLTSRFLASGKFGVPGKTRNRGFLGCKTFVAKSDNKMLQNVTKKGRKNLPWTEPNASED